MSQKQWGGRFSSDTDRRVEAITEPISYDKRLDRHDIRASQGHAAMLADCSALPHLRPHGKSTFSLRQSVSDVSCGTPVPP